MLVNTKILHQQGLLVVNHTLPLTVQVTVVAVVVVVVDYWVA
jgi:hypothetical protein